MPREATNVIESTYSGGKVKRHPYCDSHFREALAQCPLDEADKVVPVKPDEMCEECE